jgi:hypothetical protein
VREIPFIFCRFHVESRGRPLAPTELASLLDHVKGKPVAHRKADASDDDRDTLLMQPRRRRLEGYQVQTWRVGHHLATRIVDRYNSRNDVVEKVMEDTDEVHSTRFVALPAFNVMAIEDRSTGTNLPARTAASRFKSIVAQVKDVKAMIEFAGSNRDVARALDTWDLTGFSFTVRPFNPTIRKPGDKMDALLREDGIMRLRGVAEPAEGGVMRPGDEGFIREAAGLAEAGYGQVGAEGRTPSGVHAVIGKPKFEPEKHKNLKRQAESRVLKVYIEADPRDDRVEADVVLALREFFNLADHES